MCACGLLPKANFKLNPILNKWCFWNSPRNPPIFSTVIKNRLFLQYLFFLKGNLALSLSSFPASYHFSFSKPERCTQTGCVLLCFSGVANCLFPTFILRSTLFCLVFIIRVCHHSGSSRENEMRIMTITAYILFHGTKNARCNVSVYFGLQWPKLKSGSWPKLKGVFAEVSKHQSARGRWTVRHNIIYFIYMDFVVRKQWRS